MRRTVVITGASAGIGAEAAVALARRGDHVVLVGRNPDKLAAVVDRIRDDSGSTPDSHVCDFAALAEVRRTAGRIAAAYDVIDVLANNAGLIAKKQTSTVDGHDMTIQVNHLAPFLLTSLLLDRVTAAAAGRIITTSSAAHTSGWLDPDDLDFQRRRWARWRAYGDSKQANILFTTELTWRLRQTAVVATCFHPGVVRSDFGDSTGLFRLAKKLSPIGFVSPSQGASTLVQLAATEDGRGIPGAYFDSGRLARPTSRAVDPDLAERLWAVSGAMTAG
ncbi:MAG: SDR family NAD(P)-dependent oxidoreductase [Geodermatophilaceae bacterium]|nr:SDR family NAD(P)-dependent oxidoreductase [Geodermatophilaceae bacterium]